MGFSHFHGRFSNSSPFKGEVRRGMGYICRCSIIMRLLIMENANDRRIPWALYVSERLRRNLSKEIEVCGNYSF